jgi:calcineurin-like phosphoesterase family protein
MKIFFISDTHFFHKNIIKYTNRPFLDVNKMNEYIINQWNNVVSENDIIYHLGDFAIGWDKTFPDKKECYKHIMDQLNGKKILIKGNHDRESDNFYKDIGFSEVYPYLIVDGMLLTHYPLEINEYQKESLKQFIYKLQNLYNKYKLTKVIHGHIHNNHCNLKNHINVSVEAINYKPLELEKGLF